MLINPFIHSHLNSVMQKVNYPLVLLVLWVNFDSYLSNQVDHEHTLTYSHSCSLGDHLRKAYSHTHLQKSQNQSTENQ